jgi:hypothetical protein
LVSEVNAQSTNPPTAKGIAQENCKIFGRALVVPPGHRVPVVGGNRGRRPAKGGTTSDFIVLLRGYAAGFDCQAG